MAVNDPVTVSDWEAHNCLSCWRLVSDWLSPAEVTFGEFSTAQSRHWRTDVKWSCWQIPMQSVSSLLAQALRREAVYVHVELQAAGKTGTPRDCRADRKERLTRCELSAAGPVSTALQACVGADNELPEEKYSTDEKRRRSTHTLQVRQTER